MKINIKEVAEKVAETLKYNEYAVLEPLAKELVIEALDKEIRELTNEVITQVEHLAHPEPRTKAEYDEKIGVDNE